jgi:hypothetical protein
MVVYYLVRDVVRGTDCSYKAGRTLLNGDSVYADRWAAQSRADVYNAHCHVPGVCYLVLPHDENVPVDADHYEQGSYCPDCHWHWAKHGVGGTCPPAGTVATCAHRP